MFKSLAASAMSQAKAAGKAAGEQAKEQAKAAAKEAIDSAKEKATAAAKEAVENAKKQATEAVTNAVNAQMEKVKNLAASSGIPIKNTTRKNNKNTNSTNTTRKNAPATTTEEKQEDKENSKEESVAEEATKEASPAEEADKEESAAEETTEEPATEEPANKEAEKANTNAAPEEEPKPSTNSLPVAKPDAAPFTILLDNIQRYETIWKDCRATFNKFQQILKTNPEVDGKLIKIESDASNAGKYAIKTTTKVLEGAMDKIGVCKILNLFMYYEFIKSMKENGNSANVSEIKAVEFFNKIEARREYHSRICITLCSMKDDDLKTPAEGAGGVKDLDILGLNMNTFDSLERILYEKNREDKDEKPVFTAYEKAYLVNQHMTMMAEWEVAGKDGAEELGEKLFTIKRIAIIKEDGAPSDLPSHLLLLGKYTKGDAEKIRKNYPQSLVMNYSYFYPFVLYWTGKAPDATA